MRSKKPRKFRIFLIFLFAFLCLYLVFRNDDSEQMVSTKEEKLKDYFENIFSSDTFFVPEELKTNVTFWKNIFSKTSIYSVVFFTPNENINIKQVDAKFDFSLNNKGLVNIALFSEGTEIAKFTPDDFLDKSNPENFLSLTLIQTKIDEIYDDLNKKLHENGTLKEGENIGYTRGRKEKFETAWISSGAFIEQIKEIFKSEGIPEEVANLAFTESSFDCFAKSESNAVGIFQMIPGTARNHGLIVNKYVDERKDPLLEAKAAAKYLKQINENFNNWFFTINAYHSGENNLKKALEWAKKYYPEKPDNFKRSLLDYQYLKVIDEFRHDREFNNNDNLKYGKDSARYTTLFLAFLEAEKEVFAKELTRKSKTDFASIKIAYKNDHSKENNVNVNSGDTLSKISFEFGVTVEDIKKWNSLENSFIKTNQKLIIYTEEPPVTFADLFSNIKMSETEKQFIYENNFSYREKNSTYEDFLKKKIYNNTTINLPTELKKDAEKYLNQY